LVRINSKIWGSYKKGVRTLGLVPAKFIGACASLTLPLALLDGCQRGGRESTSFMVTQNFIGIFCMYLLR
jgi:hypothetical protein